MVVLTLAFDEFVVRFWELVVCVHLQRFSVKDVSVDEVLDDFIRLAIQLRQKADTKSLSKRL